MKTMIPVFAAAFMALSASTHAQSKNTPQYPVVTKGYYSIGQNAQKLQPVQKLRFTSERLLQVNKGFYALDKNREKLEKGATLLNSGASKRPVITKGYYSIGRNAEKLKK